MSATLAELEERVAALEEATLADQLTPGVFSLNAAGQIEERLSGFLEAQGVNVEIANTAGTAQKRGLRWFYELPAGKEPFVAAIYGYNPGAEEGKKEPQFIMELDDGFVQGQLAIYETISGVKHEVHAQAFVFGSSGGHLRTIIDSTGKSSFLQLPTASQASVRFGKVAIPNVQAAAGYEIEIPAWSTEHTLFLAVPSTAESLNLVTYFGSAPSGLNKGAIDMASSVNQTVTISWLSIGF
jgi:hypothetical protein